jgi:hypothetical protein
VIKGTGVLRGACTLCANGDIDGYHHFADRHFAHLDFVWWRLLRPRSLVVVTGFLEPYRGEGTCFPRDDGRGPLVVGSPTEHQGIAV